MSRISAPSRQARGKLASTVACLNKNPDDAALAEQVDQRRIEYRFLSAQDYIAQLVASAPPLTPEMRDRLALLLRSGGGEAVAQH